MKISKEDQIRLFQAEHEKRSRLESTEAPFFYPLNGRDDETSFSYKLQILEIGSMSYKHVDRNGNYVKCKDLTGRGTVPCVYCREGLRRVSSLMLKIKVLEDTRFGIPCQAHQELRWEVKKELCNLLKRSCDQHGTAVFNHVFRLVVLRSKGSNRPHYTHSKFIDEVIPQQGGGEQGPKSNEPHACDHMKEGQFPEKTTKNLPCFIHADDIAKEEFDLNFTDADFGY